MSDVAAPVAPPAKGKSLFARFVGVLTAPRETFADVVVNPRFLGMMALVLIITAICTGGFFSTQVGQTAWLDKMAEQAQQSGQEIPEAQWAAMEKMAPYMGAMSAGSAIIFAPAHVADPRGVALRGVQRSPGRRLVVQAAVRRRRAL